MNTTTSSLFAYHVYQFVKLELCSFTPTERSRSRWRGRHIVAFRWGTETDFLHQSPVNQLGSWTGWNPTVQAAEIRGVSEKHLTSSQRSRRPAMRYEIKKAVSKFLVSWCVLCMSRQDGYVYMYVYIHMYKSYIYMYKSYIIIYLYVYIFIFATCIL